MAPYRRKNYKTLTKNLPPPPPPPPRSANPTFDLGPSDLRHSSIDTNQTTMSAPVSFPRISIGAWMILGLIVAVYLAATLLRLIGLINLDNWFLLSPALVWHGQIWRVVTYPLLSGGLLNLVLDGYLILFFATGIEQTKTRSALLAYTTLCIVAAGLLRCLVTPFTEVVPPGAGVASILAAHLVAWTRIAPYETLNLVVLGNITRRTLALIIGGLITLSTLGLCGGLSALVQCLFTAAIGWTLLTIRWRWRDHQRHRRNPPPSSPGSTRRLNHLEL
ncbi:rhomboid family intramembrane serine protease [Opitutaceae bacterium TAV4]|nr:rhomboid family intramembrane serine protease [Opitutaceae bacterium TAV4]